MQHVAIAACFNREFADSHNTVMLGGAAEPLYLPATAQAAAQLFYREDYAASALHEAAHWCIAGRQRRTLVDFGYAYQPPPRSPEQQALFFNLELRTQTLERVFAQAAGVEFQPSADNLACNTGEFAQQIEATLPQVGAWLTTPAGKRAQRFHAALITAATAQERRCGTG